MRLKRYLRQSLHLYVVAAINEPPVQEQWTDGANVFALAPGVIVGYERNTKTFEALADHGYKIMDQFDFVDEYADKPFNHKNRENCDQFSGT